MNQSYFQQLLLMFKRLSLAYLLFFSGRLVFFLSNLSSFQQVSWLHFLQDAFYGLRFDSFSIAASNSLFVILSALPIKQFWTAGYQKFLRWLFFISNSVFVAFDFIDAAYFAFIKKRSTSEIFDQLGGQTDMVKMLPRFLVDYWWLVVAFAAAVYGLSFLYGGRRIQSAQSNTMVPLKSKLSRWAAFVLMLAITTLALRGGLQRVPIDIVNAGSVTRPGEAALVLNSSFSIIKSVSQSSISKLQFFTDKELNALYSPIHEANQGPMNKKNVIVLVLESFSKEYTALGKRKSITPFLDSLMEHALLFTNGFANGTKSIEGIPAILSGLPSLMKNPIINSIYANNHQSSLPFLLKKEGYYSAFFHGGINGTMNFDDWSVIAGYDAYYGKNEYNNEADYDGYWGIWDEPFLKYCDKTLQTFKQPFHAAIFTLSSHHPYFVPEKYKGKFPKTDLENSESIAYADYALRLFFEAAKRSNWYNNSIFVLVADHTGISGDPFYSRIVGGASIPILFYVPNDSLVGKYDRAFSQTDILPSVLDYLKYPHPYFAFGESYQQDKPNGDYLFADDAYFLMSDSLLSVFEGANLRSLYNYKRDSLLNSDIKKLYPNLSNHLQVKHRAFIQVYNQAVIDNTMALPK